MKKDTIERLIERFQVASQQRRRKIERRVDIVEATRDAVFGKLCDVDFGAEQIAKRIGVFDPI